MNWRESRIGKKLRITSIDISRSPTASMVSTHDKWTARYGRLANSLRIGTSELKREESPSFYLNSYTPLVRTEAGKIASKKFKLPPFIDGSIRWEPDLEHKWRAVTCLCRAGKFAPRLQPGDVVAYTTITGNWHKPGSPQLPRHRRLTTVLRVVDLCYSHDEAARWYRKRGLTLPSNCVVEGNPAKPLRFSHRLTRFRCAMSDDKLHGTWDSAYRKGLRNSGGS